MVTNGTFNNVGIQKQLQKWHITIKDGYCSSYCDSIFGAHKNLLNCSRQSLKQTNIFRIQKGRTITTNFDQCVRFILRSKCEKSDNVRTTFNVLYCCCAHVTVQFIITISCVLLSFFSLIAHINCMQSCASTSLYHNQLPPPPFSLSLCVAVKTRVCHRRSFFFFIVSFSYTISTLLLSDRII